ncbi:hypothetical protein PAHAL_4G285900 [Panicum hallii]|uniref:Uncharacterized protein n=1 Tax=Panicum hallii TaxID=206008 RepID=A0A2S3HKU7_9POAL|nr:hypothetical protein PAHAL_4G285900 [Panicum hallii]
MVPRRRGIEIRGRWLEACPAVCGRKLVGARRRAPGAGRSGRWRSSGSGVGGLRGRRRDLARSTGPAQDAEVKERRRWRLQLGNTAGTRSRRGAGMVYLPPPTGLVHPRPRESQQVWFITRPRQFLQFRGSWTGVFIWFVRILTAKCCSSGKAWTTDSRQIVKI